MWQITRILGDRRLFPIGQAVNWLVGNASNPIVMFLEKDFALIEDPQYVVPRLDDGRLMLKTGEADVVRYRSRTQAGEPNYAEGMFKDREHVILQRQVRSLRVSLEPCMLFRCDACVCVCVASAF